MTLTCRIVNVVRKKIMWYNISDGREWKNNEYRIIKYKPEK